MHRRSPETVDIRLGDLKCDLSFSADDPLVRTYVNLELGKVKIA